MALYYRRGFTLIEIAIVMVIIGLIIAGIFVGRDMITASKFRKVHKQQEEISSAVQTFRNKYNCMPGDCENATQWFGDHGDCPDLTTATTGTPGTYTNMTPVISTCNGDGDRRIDASITVYETTTLWQHLGNAGLIGGIYAGGVDFSDQGAVVGVNSPPVTAFPNFLWFAFDGDNFELLAAAGLPNPSLALVPSRHYGTILNITSNSTQALLYPFTPSETYAFDQKFDDGNPVTGRMIQMRDLNGAHHCTDAADETDNSAANATAKYLANDSTYKDQPGCSIAYITGW